MGKPKVGGEQGQRPKGRNACIQSNSPWWQRPHDISSCSQRTHNGTSPWRSAPPLQNWHGIVKNIKWKWLTIIYLNIFFSQISAVARIRNALAYATHLFFQERGFLYLHTPIITASDCEGAGEMFQITTLLAPHVNHFLQMISISLINYSVERRIQNALARRTNGYDQRGGTGTGCWS